MRASKRAGDLVFALHLPRYMDLSSRLKKTGRIFVGGSDAPIGARGGRGTRPTYYRTPKIWGSYG